MDKSVQQ